MFVNTNKISNVIIFLDTLISINGTRPTTSIFMADINPTTTISIGPEILAALKFITSHYRYSFVSQYIPKDLNRIRASLKPYLALCNCFAPKKKSLLSTVGPQINAAIRTLGFVPCETIFFSGDSDTIKKAMDSHLGTICWHTTGQNLGRIHEIGPDFLTYSAQNCKDIFIGKKMGYLSEVLASPSNLIINKPDKPIHQFVQLPNNERVGEPIFAGGRYFSTKDVRYNRHALSIRIINSKDHMDRQKKIFSLIMGHLITGIAVHTKIGPELITRIPPKPGEHDRLAEQLEAIPIITQGEVPKSRISPNLLRCTRNYTSQKSVGYAQRRGNVRGVFSAGPGVAGKTVYVMDDVVTSGSTLKEACRVLYAAGAKRVIPMAMAYHPNNNIAKTPELICNTCKKGTMKPRCAQNGDIFYGCSNYTPGGCNISCNFSPGVQWINKTLKN
ncbi:MAG: hypothetical protein KKC20_24135 [Proteobacteria bacterium]|nr:hypothetical protein [Pseudomonadota bacterium]